MQVRNDGGMDQNGAVQVKRGAQRWTYVEKGVSRVYCCIGYGWELSRMTARLWSNLLSGSTCCSLEQERWNLMCIVLERPGSELLIGERTRERRESHKGFSSPTQHGKDDKLRRHQWLASHWYYPFLLWWLWQPKGMRREWGRQGDAWATAHRELDT